MRDHDFKIAIAVKHSHKILVYFFNLLFNLQFNVMVYFTMKL